MPHAYILPDPIHTAIQRHRAAYDAFQVAPEGYASVEANDEYDAASNALVATACSTRFGALALLGHLSWWLGTAVGARPRSHWRDRSPACGPAGPVLILQSDPILTSPVSLSMGMPGFRVRGATTRRPAMRSTTRGA